MQRLTLLFAATLFTIGCSDTSDQTTATTPAEPLVTASDNFRCFASLDSAATQHLQLTFLDGHESATVRLAGSASEIAMRLTEERIADESQAGRPSLMESSYSALSGEKLRFQHEGARIYQFEYIDATGRSIAFEENLTLMGDSSCDW